MSAAQLVERDMPVATERIVRELGFNPTDPVWWVSPHTGDARADLMAHSTLLKATHHPPCPEDPSRSGLGLAPSADENSQGERSDVTISKDPPDVETSRCGVAAPFRG